MIDFSKRIFLLGSLFLITHLSVAQANIRCEDLGLIVNAKSLNWIDSQLNVDVIRGSSVIPNERNTQDLASILQSQVRQGESGGVYLAVGTERGPIGAWLGGAKAILWVDRNTDVTAYNYFMRGLLAIAKNREDYIYLRLHAPFEEIRGRVEEKLHSNSIDPEIISPLFSSKFKTWWTRAVRNSEDWKGFDRDLLTSSDFQKGNYLNDDLGFQYIQDIILKGRTYILNSDLANVDLISDTLKEIYVKEKLSLRILDLSNAWEEGYLGHNKTMQLIEGLSQQSDVEGYFNVVFSYMKANSHLPTGVSTPWTFLLKAAPFNSSLNATYWSDILRLLAQSVSGPTVGFGFPSSRSRVNADF